MGNTEPKDERMPSTYYNFNCLTNLPEELLRIIIKQLDFKSIYNLHETGHHHIQYSICSAIRKFDFSLSTMATARALHSSFFQNIATNLQDLDLEGVHDLTISTLLPALKTTERLVTLNVAYTNITLLDFLAICDQSPTIRNISTDFKIGEGNEIFLQDSVPKFQKIFASLKQVNFVGSFQNLLNSSLPELILKKAELISLTYTLARSNSDVIKNYVGKTCAPVNIQWKNFNVLNNFMWKGFSEEFTCLKKNEALKPLHLRYAFIYIKQRKDITDISCSPVVPFTDFLKQHFTRETGVELRTYLINRNFQIMSPFDHNTNYNAYLFWDIEKTKFDDTFYQKLLAVLKRLIPCRVHVDCPEPLTSNKEDLCNWIWIREDHNPICFVDSRVRRKKSVTALKSCDSIFCDTEKVELRILSDFLDAETTLSPNFTFFHKLTYIWLSPHLKYHPDFFKILFRSCKNLVTVNAHLGQYNSIQLISNYVNLSCSLKNLRIVAHINSFSELLSIRCKSLENCIIQNLNGPTHNKHFLNADGFIQFHENLFNLCIGFRLGEIKEDIIRMQQMLIAIKENHKRYHLRIEVGIIDDFEYRYTPFVKVFKLHALIPSKQIAEIGQSMTA